MFPVPLMSLVIFDEIFPLFSVIIPIAFFFSVPVLSLIWWKEIRLGKACFLLVLLHPWKTL